MSAKYKLFIPSILIIVVLLSGCVDDRNLQTNTKYPIINIDIGNDNIDVVILDGSTIKFVPIWLVDSFENRRGAISTGTIVLDNESYLKVIWVERSSKYSIFSLDNMYSEIHVTQEDLKIYLRK